jgi:hypothetical protein
MMRCYSTFAWLACVGIAGLLGFSGSIRAADPPGRRLQRWEKMDYGSFLTASIKANGPKNNNTNKGIVIPLGKTKAAICFDIDLLRWSAGWVPQTSDPTDGPAPRMADFLALKGTPYDGGHGSWPEVKGQQLFGTSPQPGWARPDSKDFKDPRTEPFGPLPAEWGRYKGLYRHGDKVVLAYTVGNCLVQELPGVEIHEGQLLITRTMNLGPSSKPLTLLIAEGDKGQGSIKDGIVTFAGPRKLQVGISGAPEKAQLELKDDKVLLTLPASTEARAFRISLASFTKPEETASFKAFVAKPVDTLDLKPLLNGGPTRWKETVKLQGMLGKGDGAYVVDTITTPDDNPYNSWLRFAGFDFFSDGRAALCTWSGDVWIVSGIDDKLDKLVWKRFAAGLFQPLGLKIVDDKVYTLGREGIIRLHDLDGDGEADFYECFNGDVHTTTGFHEFAFDLQTDPQGNFYYAKAGPVKGGGRGFDYIGANSGCILKVSKDGRYQEVYASGLRAPNGIGVGPKGEVTSGDNEGTWTPMCRLSLARQGGFLGCVDTYHGDKKPVDFDPPICWMPKNVDNSSGGQTWVTSDKWGPLKGQLLHTAYGTSSLFVAPFERDGDLVQGGVVRMPVTFLSGVMRPRFSPFDGQLYITGLRGWQTNAARDTAFQRVRYTGKPAHLITGIKVVKNGLQLTFTEPLDPTSAGNADNYSCKQWNYLWCSEYGSAHYSAKDPEFHQKTLEYNRLRENAGKNKNAIAELARSFKIGEDKVPIKSATLSPDGKTVTLEIEDLRPVMQMNVKFKVKAADGGDVNLEVYNTINKVPR